MIVGQRHASYAFNLVFDEVKKGKLMRLRGGIQLMVTCDLREGKHFDVRNDVIKRIKSQLTYMVLNFIFFIKRYKFKLCKKNIYLKIIKYRS